MFIASLLDQCNPSVQTDIIAFWGLPMRGSRYALAFVAIAAAIGLTGCSTLPRSGPEHGDVDKGAAVKVTSEGGAVGIDYVLVDVTKDILPYLTPYQDSSLRSGFGGGRGPAPRVPLGSGDVLQVSIFEAGSGGLFIPADAGSRPGNFITLPAQVVDSAGTITVPYAGQIRVSGRLPSDVQADIESRLANRAIEPQVLITVNESRSNQVAVLGDVNSPGKFEVSAAGERVLDVISRAGGISTPGVETYVTLERRGKQATVLFNALVKNPRENIYVTAGDTVYVNRERRTYLVFGAAGLNGRIDFEEADLTLGDALGKAGGLLDGRADPAEVFVYRQTERSVVSKFGADLTRFSGNKIPVVYRANLRDPAAFFAAQKFPMQDRDILYISNAASGELIKFLTVVNSVSTTVGGVPSDVLSARDSIRALGD